jgi:hypothetical protein
MFSASTVVGVTTIAVLMTLRSKKPVALEI